MYFEIPHNQKVKHESMFQELCGCMFWLFLFYIYVLMCVVGSLLFWAASLGPFSKLLL